MTNIDLVIIWAAVFAAIAAPPIVAAVARRIEYRRDVRRRLRGGRS